MDAYEVFNVNSDLQEKFLLISMIAEIEREKGVNCDASNAIWIDVLEEIGGEQEDIE